MRPRWANLNKQEIAAFRATVAFLNGRLEEDKTVIWALQLKPHDTIKRLALLELIGSPSGRNIREPWRSAWHLIEESWDNQTAEDYGATNVYDFQHRLRAGDRSGPLVTAIVDLVAPRLKVEPFSPLHLHYQKPPKQPKKVEDIFSTELTSGEIVNPGVLDLEVLAERSFLVSLAIALDAAVAKGLDIARRIGWDGERRLWHLGQLHRVYYVPPAERSDEENEPDEYHRGIAPSVKLLHSVVSRLVDIDNPSAVEFVHRWKLTNSPIHLRLWAALSRDSRVTPANEVGTLLISLNNECFWNLHYYPEIAELRAKRFGELEPHIQAILTARIRKCPPRNQWPRNVETDRIESARLYWAVRELRRIEVAGNSLPKRDKAWLDARINEFSDLVKMARLDEGFLESPKARWVPPNPDSRYDLFTGEERLKALEAALSTTRGRWESDSAEGAKDWIKKPGNPVQVIADFESMPDGGSAFARVWEWFGWVHSPEVGQDKDGAQRDLQAESSQVLSLLAKLPETTVRQAIDGISHWLSTWEKQVVVLPTGPTGWFKVWPVAVEATNAKQPLEEEINLNTVVQSSNDREPMDLDTLNTSAGKLVGVFLAACRTVKPGDAPFLDNTVQRQMRDAVEASIGPAGLIVKYRLIEGLNYFLKADSEWTISNLVTPLLKDNSDARVLWRAVAHRTRFFEELKLIGEPMAERTTDRRLGRETRRSLVFSLVIECLHAFHEKRDPAVPNVRIQQMIRSLDDEVRAYGADAVQRFVHAISTPHEGEQAPPSPEQLFRDVAARFLRDVWPQEHSLATPGVSQALADLPATAQDAFAEAVDAIERFLVPFECWSMHDYGLHGEEDKNTKLSTINNPEKAAAFLRLLDLTIGTAEGSIVPYDLADALDQIRKVAPTLAENRVFRRLATMTRR
ncbi:MAG: hypothetical protein PHI12_11390 [Dehalococcoidales bacterium]|nr:hypothetical protein [Dehalococcoidales bacterium]